ncbi:M15 family metallopeptidase [Dyella acidiphila]|uniref:M15 family metallopeptidase n=1 Tax=Dyella acidiphila TaxID=2775866 RepID=A0ABR9GAL5_9GAMM|nr:M15 family metallopeptidase [Dyella acidiphila]MBE1161085.1 M15 family metallopeptidase [Dyella acidiphila]
MDPIFAWLLLLLAAALLVLWLLVFPDARSAVGKWLAKCVRRVTARTKQWQHHSSKTLQHQSRHTRDSFAHMLGRLARHRGLLLALVLILLLPPLLIVGLHRHAMLDGYEVSTQADQDTTNLVAALLKGEQLAPPPPLPPAVFVTKEVQMVRPDLGSASRDWDKLYPDFRQRLLVVFKIMKERYGYDMALIEGYRSPERQAMLASQGSSVTNAGAYQSYHQYGLAADCGFFRDGKLVISEKDPWAMRGYQLYGEVAQAAGLVWGGNWKMMDLGHVELHAAGIGPRYR